MTSKKDLTYGMHLSGRLNRKLAEQLADYMRKKSFKWITHNYKIIDRQILLKDWGITL